MKKLTLILVVQRERNRILLGMKKRGFGAGKWNGFGGKVEAGETIEEACLRELSEEAGVRALDARQVGRIVFEFEGDPVLLDVSVFRATQLDGEPCETEEMRPQWFPLDAIPFDAMWLDDKLWFPFLIGDRMFRAFFLFRGHDAIVRHTLVPVAALGEVTAAYPWGDAAPAPAPA